MKQEKKKNLNAGTGKRGPQQNKSVQKPYFADEEEIDNVRMLMDDSG